jgi:hypothetical protein
MASNNYASYYIPPSAVQRDNYVSAQTTGPLSTSQTPGQIRYHSYGVLNGVHPNPPQFYPANNSSEFSQARFQYARTATSVQQQVLARKRAVEQTKNNGGQYFSASTQKEYPQTGHMNYITPPASSLHTSVLKSRAVGKSSYKQGLPPSAALSYKSYDRNDVKTILGRLRRAGCAAPAKKGSIYNRSCTAGGGICNIGAFSGQGY